MAGHRIANQPSRRGENAHNMFNEHRRLRAFSELGRILQIRVLAVSHEQLRHSVQRATHVLQGLGMLV